MTRQAGVRFDPFLASYLATLHAVLEPLASRRTLDIAAGSGWIRALGFDDYAGLDIEPPHEIWDIDTPLPAGHVGDYELALCLGALHYAADPHASLDEFRRALRPDGDLVLMVPWLYPPHDREADRWRIAPRQLFTMLAPHFAQVDLWFVGSVFQLPAHIAKRVIAGPFRGITPEELRRLPRRLAAPRQTPGDVDDVPVPWFGPLNVVAHARSMRENVASPTRKR
ncbi:MAG: methyltransferase domain-containing protein [Nitriliruptoraceae bacterium]